MNDIHNPELYQAFAEALDAMSDDLDNITAAYKKANVYNQEYTPHVQRKVLKQYSRLADSPFEPIDKKEGNRITMTGITFSHEGQKYDIDFTDPDCAKYKEMFDKGYADAMLYPRTTGQTASITVYTDETDQNKCSIEEAKGAHGCDPLAEETAGLTMDVIRFLKRENPDLQITVDSERYIDIQKDERGGNVFTSFSPMCFGHDDVTLFHADKDTKPEEMFSTHTTEKKVYRDKFKTIERTHEETLDLTDYIGQNIDNPEISEIHKNAMDRKAGFISKSEHQYLVNMRKEDKTTSRDSFFAMLTEYGERASIKEMGDRTIYNHGFEIDAGKEQMLNYLSLIEASIKDRQPYEIHQACMKQRINIQNTDDIAKVAGSMMKNTVTRTGSKETINLYPVFDRTTIDTQYSKKPLALAGINGRTWEPVGILRLDDPEAAPIYNRMLNSVAEKMGIRTTAISNRRIIPDSQKPDFMKQESAPEIDNQYE